MNFHFSKNQVLNFVFKLQPGVGLYNKWYFKVDIDISHIKLSVSKKMRPEIYYTQSTKKKYLFSFSQNVSIVQSQFGMDHVMQSSAISLSVCHIDACICCVQLLKLKQI